MVAGAHPHNRYTQWVGLGFRILGDHPKHEQRTGGDFTATASGDRNANGCRAVPPDVADSADGTAFAPNTNFTTTWVVMNTGTTTWNTSDFDVMFVGSSSQRMHLGPDVYDLTSQVDPNWTYTVSLGMLAPSATGSYTETWSIVRGSTTVCTFWVTILVRLR